MGRSGYADYFYEDQWSWIRWRGAVSAAILGQRGQALIRDLIAALDAMPEKRLVTGALKVQMGDEFEDEYGEPWGPKSEEHCGVCALGAVGSLRGMSDDRMRAILPDDHSALSEVFDIAKALACEIMYINDEHWTLETPEQRWQRVRNWAESNLSIPSTEVSP